MKLTDIKKEMLAYEDFYGGDFSDTDEIKKAKSKEELLLICNKHEDFLTDMLADALSHLQNFKDKIGLTGF